MSRGAWTKNALGWAALAAAIAGLAATVLPPVWIDPPAWSLRDELRGVLSRAARHRHELDSAAYQTALRTWERIAAGLALAGVVLAVIAGIRKQHRLLVVSALGLGAVALLWEYIAAAVFVAIVVMAIAAMAT
jgi:hypothetical protein